MSVVMFESVRASETWRSCLAGEETEWFGAEASEGLIFLV